MTTKSHITSFALIAGLSTILSAASAQTQDSMGACSPNVNGNNNDISVTCLTKERRIRVGKFEGDVSNNNLDPFISFLSKNEDKVIFVDIVFSNEIKEGPLGPHVDFRNIGGMDEWDYAIYMPEGNPAYFANGVWVLKGFFVPSFSQHITNGIVPVRLDQIDRNKILFSEKYEFD